MQLIITPYFILSLLVGFMGINRKLGFWGYFFGSLLLTPIVGLIIVLASDRKQNNNTTSHG